MKFHEIEITIEQPFPNVTALQEASHPPQMGTRESSQVPRAILEMAWIMAGGTITSAF